MTHVEEIKAALRSRPTPMFLLGLAALAAREPMRTYRELATASEEVYAEDKAATVEAAQN